MCKKQQCPQCLSTKKYMEVNRDRGFKYKDCTLCDENGEVSETILEDFTLSINEEGIEFDDD